MRRRRRSTSPRSSGSSATTGSKRKWGCTALQEEGEEKAKGGHCRSHEEARWAAGDEGVQRSDPADPLLSSPNLSMGEIERAEASSRSQDQVEDRRGGGEVGFVVSPDGGGHGELAGGGESFGDGSRLDPALTASDTHLSSSGFVFPDAVCFSAVV